ncbi:MAG: MBL fold metallo-hydrolase [bacterium]
MSTLQFLPLGGANEVGASSYYIGSGERGILMDCGIRVKEVGEASLPEVHRLKDLKVDIVLITHAHIDHIGALPIIHKMFPDAEIFATKPTKELSKLMLLDMVKIGEQQGVSLFGIDDVMECTDSIKEIPFDEMVDFNGIRFIPRRAGHILGACYYIINFEGYRFLYTGDISITNQYTVESAVLPEEVTQLDFVISESTYGNILLPSRRDEIRAFIMAIKSILAKGGRILIPSFALGRSQEIILILLSAITNRELPPGLPIYIDGLVRTITQAYTDLGNYLPERLKSFIMNSRQDPFLRDPVVIVSSSSKRRSIVKDTRPSIIIASSGMLTGGVSPIYARSILQEENSAVFFVGYQDEDAPGRKLLELKQGDMIMINGEEIPILCQIDQYKLSAHADSGSLQNFLARFPSYSLILVHGEAEARDHLFNALKTSRVVWKPNNGEGFDPLSTPTWITPQAERQEVIRIERAKATPTIERRDDRIALVFPSGYSKFFDNIDELKAQLVRSPDKLTINIAGKGKSNSTEEDN